MKKDTLEILNRYCEKYSYIEHMRDHLCEVINMLEVSFNQGGQLLVCGNGGSGADADHIVGELVKSFKMKRQLTSEMVNALIKQGEDGAYLANNLQGSLPAINLCAHSALLTAMINDVGGEYIFAQQVLGYGKANDVFLGISTSGNSKNVLFAGHTAKAKKLKTIGLTGRKIGKMDDLFDVVLHADAEEVEDIQDMHSVIYHAICAMIESQFWGN